MSKVSWRMKIAEEWWTGGRNEGWGIEDSLRGPRGPGKNPASTWVAVSGLDISSILRYVQSMRTCI